MAKDTKKRGVLLASFLTGASEQQIMHCVSTIASLPSLASNNIFLFENTEDPSRHLLTYNLYLDQKKQSNNVCGLYTIRLHRKKDTNTLYTINALNAAVREQHGGQTGKHLKVDWSQYPNSLLLTSQQKLQVHPVEVIKIFKIEDDPEEN